MKNFFEVISELYPYPDNRVVTVIEGEDLGAKSVFSNSEMIFESKQGSFSPEMQKIILDQPTGKVINSENKKMFSESLGSGKKLVICGAGHVSIPIVKIGKMLGFHVTAIDDRALYADNARRAEADLVFCEEFGKALDGVNGDADTFFVIVTRGHRYDEVCLDKILKKEHAYIGMIGSKVRVRTLKEVFMEKGYTKEELDSIYAPIGLSIGAQTPEEISISIMGEIIQIKNRSGRNYAYPKEILDVIIKDKEKEPKILATIVSRKGSAPRELGTKMLIYRDGRTVGTIGGGCVEGEVCEKARYQLTLGDKNPKLITADLTGRDAENEGMVCGGIIDILLEVI